MPYIIKKNVDGTYAVINKETGEKKAKHTSKAKAEAQVRFLLSLEHGMKPRK